MIRDPLCGRLGSARPRPMWPDQATATPLRRPDGPTGSSTRPGRHDPTARPARPPDRPTVPPPADRLTRRWTRPAAAPLPRAARDSLPDVSPPARARALRPPTTEQCSSAASRSPPCSSPRRRAPPPPPWCSGARPRVAPSPRRRPRARATRGVQRCEIEGSHRNLFRGKARARGTLDAEGAPTASIPLAATDLHRPQRAHGGKPSDARSGVAL